MSKPYASGELPRVGDDVDMAMGQGPRARVIAVVGGDTAGAAEGVRLEEWTYLGPGILVDQPGAGLVYENHPDREVILVHRPSPEPRP